MLQNENKYFDLVTRLCAEEQLTVSGFAEKYGIQALPQIIARLKRNPQGGMHLNTLTRIEKAVGIKIIDNGDILEYERVGKDEYETDGGKIKQLKEEIKGLREDMEIISAMCERLAGQVRKIADKSSNFPA